MKKIVLKKSALRKSALYDKMKMFQSDNKETNKGEQLKEINRRLRRQYQWQIKFSTPITIPKTSTTTF